MADDSSEDRTEDPTSKKQEEAKEKGQVARSREFSSAIVLLMTATFATSLGSMLVTPILDVAKVNFGFEPMAAFEPHVMVDSLVAGILEVAKVFLLLLVGVFLAAIASAILVGGWNFSLQALQPKLSKMDPIKGLTERVFSKNGLVELVKAVIKFILIGSVGVFWIYTHLGEYMDLANLPVMEAIVRSLGHLLVGYFLLVATTFVIAAIDVPYQIYQNSQKLKMTKQEVKDEYKNTEGKPEVNGRIRQLQRELSQRKMMGNVPEADVIITNPTHFSVALRYKPDEGGAPKLIAKGADILALKIREIGTHHKIMQIESPLLCRAVYYTTDVDKEIPRGLYKAVAQILAFVFQMQEYKKGRQDKPYLSQKFEIPDEYQFDSKGRKKDDEEKP